MFRTSGVSSSTNFSDSSPMLGILPAQQSANDSDTIMMHDVSDQMLICLIGRMNMFGTTTTGYCINMIKHQFECWHHCWPTSGMLGPNLVMQPINLISILLQT